MHARRRRRCRASARARDHRTAAERAKSARDRAERRRAPVCAEGSKRANSRWVGPWKSEEPVLSRPSSRSDRPAARPARGYGWRRSTPRRRGPRRGSGRSSSTPHRDPYVPERVGPHGHAAGVVDRLDRLGHGGLGAGAEGRPAVDQVGHKERRAFVEPLGAQPLRIGGVVDRRVGEMRAPDRLAPWRASALEL